MEREGLVSALRDLRSRVDALLVELGASGVSSPAHVLVTENGGERVLILDGAAFYGFRRGRRQSCHLCPFYGEAGCRESFTLAAGGDLTCARGCFVFFQPQLAERDFMLSMARAPECG